MEVHFFKYQGAGNDFVIIDNRQEFFPKNDTRWIAQLCDRRFGIGADGLILLENDESSDFKMVYFNPDGTQIVIMCGNGSRCLVAFARYLGIIDKEATFRAGDGLHYATIEGNIVNVKLRNVEEIQQMPDYTFMNTGTPHHVQLVQDLEHFEVKKEGAKLRYGLYGQTGSNINFVEQSGADIFQVRTYERGVEDETFSCGTGVTAVALAMHKLGKTLATTLNFNTLGGDLSVSFTPQNGGYTDIYLKGPATQVYKGELAY